MLFFIALGTVHATTDVMQPLADAVAALPSTAASLLYGDDDIDGDDVLAGDLGGDGDGGEAPGGGKAASGDDADAIKGDADAPPADDDDDGDDDDDDGDDDDGSVPPMFILLWDSTTNGYLRGGGGWGDVFLWLLRRGAEGDNRAANVATSAGTRRSKGYSQTLGDIKKLAKERSVFVTIQVGSLSLSLLFSPRQHLLT